MGDIAPELAEFRSSRPGCLAEVRALERARRMLREGEPETRRVRPGRYVPNVCVVRVGDPVRRHRVIRGNQDFLGVLPAGLEVQAVGRVSERSEVGRVAGLGRMTLGLDG